MLVGEQPGDQEDLAGRPFVGPAGQLLDRALAQAGLDRRRLYLTNAVKHFKFKSRGKRRLHEKPLDAEILACLPWLQAEIARIRAGAGRLPWRHRRAAQLGRAVRINEERGRILDGMPRLLLTFHPSYLLRLTDAAAAADAFDKLVADLRLARRAGLASQPAGTAVTAPLERLERNAMIATREVTSSRLPLRAALVMALIAATFLSGGRSATAQDAAPYEPTRGQAGKDVVWIPTPDALVTRMLKLAQVTSKDFVVDLGAGDGKIVIAAARDFGARGPGLEYDGKLVEHAVRNAEAAGVVGAAPSSARPTSSRPTSAMRTW